MSKQKVRKAEQVRKLAEQMAARHAAEHQKLIAAGLAQQVRASTVVIPDSWKSRAVLSFPWLEDLAAAESGPFADAELTLGVGVNSCGCCGVDIVMAYASLKRHGYASVALHRRGGVWEVCGDETPVTRALGPRAVELANERSEDDWHAAAIRASQAHVDMAQEQVARAQDQLDEELECLRREACRAAVVGCQDQRLRSVAAAMLPTWTGTAEELLEAAKAVLA